METTDLICKKHLCCSTKKTWRKYESLRTLLVEVEEIINSRPITCDNINVSSIVSLNPMQLLNMKTNVFMPPPGIFQKEDMYC